ncbi:hypothetical protein [Aliarcobacter vitoriensis]|uniref:Uncharacterized protein n=1 Tax=Aliarcobacter vitoriensis TaxID=2011099 RepID=A0A366MQ70_9BACT|nr:hypothetical protein [Aliarcobacter vitoriensis]RBQ28416.1 hypothetical protein CRU91_09350 [Aliarcobacter vitoriensis]
MNNKLNPLKTKHDLTLVIDDVSYKFTYKPVNIQTQSELDDFKNKNSLEYEKIDEKRAELKDLKEMKALNEEIVKDVNLIDKAKIFFEQKELLKKISALEKELKELEKDIKNIDDVVEEYYQKQFELCVIGDGKVALQNAIEDAGISYAVINVYLQEALKEAVEKK